MGTTNPLSQYVKDNYQKVRGCECQGTHDRWNDLARFLQGKKRVFVEYKVDGMRVFVFKGKDAVVITTKHNGIYKHADYPALFSELEGMLPEMTILDGEFVRKAETLYLWDCLHVGSEDFRELSLERRMRMLAHFARTTDHVKVMHPFLIDDEGAPEKMLQIIKEVYYPQMIREGWEGCVVKDADAPYFSRRSAQKVKDEDPVDLFVISERRNPSGEITYELGCYDAQGNVVHVGGAYSAVDGVDRSKIHEGTVLKVRHQPTKGFKKLRHPTILGIHDDKLPSECLLEQLPEIAAALSSFGG